MLRKPCCGEGMCLDAAVRMMAHDGNHFKAAVMVIIGIKWESTAGGNIVIMSQMLGNLLICIASKCLMYCIYGLRAFLIFCIDQYRVHH